jgi:hypothetical protein
MQQVSRVRAPGRQPREPVGFRISPELRKRLDVAAIEKTRSLSQEAEFRLEMSFSKEDLLPSVQQLAYGPGLADTVQKIVAAVKASHLEGRYLAEVRPQDMDSMWADPLFFEEVANAIKGALDKMLAEKCTAWAADHPDTQERDRQALRDAMAAIDEADKIGGGR